MFAVNKTDAERRMPGARAVYHPGRLALGAIIPVVVRHDAPCSIKNALLLTRIDNNEFMHALRTLHECNLESMKNALAR